MNLISYLLALFLITQTFRLKEEKKKNKQVLQERKRILLEIEKLMKQNCPWTIQSEDYFGTAIRIIQGIVLNFPTEEAWKGPRKCVNYHVSTKYSWIKEFKKYGIKPHNL